MIFRLPKTSYVKLVDYWLLFTLAIPLVEVLLHTMIANYNMKIENEKACKVFLETVRLLWDGSSDRPLTNCK